MKKLDTMLKKNRLDRQSILKKELSYRVCQTDKTEKTDNQFPRKSYHTGCVKMIKNYFLAFKAVSIKIPYVFYMPISFSLGKFAISLI